jgi:hypothetical protein
LASHQRVDYRTGLQSLPSSQLTLWPADDSQAVERVKETPAKNGFTRFDKTKKEFKNKHHHTGLAEKKRWQKFRL